MQSDPYNDEIKKWIDSSPYPVIGKAGAGDGYEEAETGDGEADTGNGETSINDYIDVIVVNQDSDLHNDPEDPAALGMALCLILLQNLLL
jgi:hypothetical protein